LVLALAGALMALAGCCNIINPECNPPYIRQGFACCLDEDGNSICDSDEYVCGNGDVVTDPDLCPEPYECGDGTAVYDPAECPPPAVQCRDGTMVYREDECREGPDIEAPGYYSCNKRNSSWPCSAYIEYCERFTPTDIAVRGAAAEAISRHPGAYSVNQLIDIYDWTKKNVFYQNVPLDMGMPYSPSETLRTKSGDCKNQAVLVASMIEAVGGSAEVLIVPDCKHAFPLAYLGNESNKDIFMKAVRSHYPAAANQTLHTYKSTDEDNVTVHWVLMDTAGAHYPGDTIDGCLNGTQTFEIKKCAFDGELNAPETARTEYGPWVLVDETKIISPGWTHYREMSGLWDKAHEYCRYNITLRSQSGFMDWFVTGQGGYDGYRDDRAFSYTCGGKGVMSGECEAYRDTKESLYLIVHDPNANIPVTVDIYAEVRCYGP
jgi:hypothetical protein